MNSAIIELYRHKTWATLRLIEHCQSLDDDALASTTPGTYGSIRDTLRHLVTSDEDYLSQLTGIPMSDPLPEGFVLMDELAERIRRSASRWEALANDQQLPVREITAPDGWRFPGAVLMAQAAHHGDDHRTHILSIIGARGLEVPRLDEWSYAKSHGLLCEPRSTAATD
jgi:uncharacterized damage-inducible protein DinB